MPDLPSPFTGDPLTRADAGRLADALQVLADPARLQILAHLHRWPDSRVMDLVGPLGLTQPTVSHHIGLLVEAGLVERSQHGPSKPLRLVSTEVNAIANALATPVGRRP